LTLVADALLLFAVSAFVYVGLVVTIHLPFFPLRQVVVSTALHQVSLAQLEFAARKAVTGNFFTIDLDAVRTEFERQPWVRRASVRRLWPDGIELSLEEHRAMARWAGGSSNADTHLVNSYGEVFGTQGASAQAALPLFSGPEGSAALLLSRYEGFSKLLAPIGHTLRVVALSPRLAWELKLDDGLTLELGRDDPKHPLDERLTRFSTLYAAIKVRINAPASAIDMRYRNGLVVRFDGNNKGDT
jgi:cell division protein FtsQ